MLKENFEKLVKDALADLPEHIREKMDNVAIVVEERPSEEDLREHKITFRNLLLGTYHGVPKTAWGRGFGMRLPDKITIFQEPIESLARTKEEITEIVKNTVWHEIAHHFGFSEKGVRELEIKKRRTK